ncbi:hypothetical protein PvNV_051 [Penaeus vannamei nudivirus]|nr:hypothetical protein PvSNPV_051 [Penaeus vannamei nucleopolyhedrovirus]
MAEPQLKYRSNVYIRGAVSGDQLQKSTHNEVFLERDENYSVVFKNYTNNRMRAHLTISGTPISDFVIEPNSSVDIRRMVSENKPLQFKPVENMTADETSKISNLHDLHRVKVEVYYEIPKELKPTRPSIRPRPLPGLRAPFRSADQSFAIVENFDVETRPEVYEYKLTAKPFTPY